MKAKSLLCGVIFLAAGAYAQDLSQNVTLDLPAATLPAILQQISAQTGLKLQAQEPLAREVVVVSVKGVPLQQLLDRIATVTAGKWVERDGGRFLALDTEMARQQERAEFQAQVGRIRDEISKLSSATKDTFSQATARQLAQEAVEISKKLRQSGEQIDPALWTRQDQIRAQGPTGRLLARVAAALDPEALAAIPDNQRRVFSTSPTRMQLPLGSAANAALREFATEYAAFANAMAAAIPPGQEDSLIGDNLFFGPLRSQPEKLLVVASRWAGDAGINLQIEVVDSQGRYIAQSWGQLMTADFDVQGSPAAEAPAQPEKPLQISQDVLAIMSLGTEAGGSGRRPLELLPGQLRQRILHPEENDPLGWVAGDLLRAIAEARQQNLVANLPDTVFPISTYPIGQQTPSAVLSMIQAMGGLKLEEKDGWLHFSPTKPAAARAARGNRAAIGELLRLAASKGELTLDQVANYALATPNNGFGSLEYLVPSLFLDDLVRFLEPPVWDILRLYGSLSPNQKQTLLAGKGIPLGSLSKQQQEIVSLRTFFRPYGLAFTNNLGADGEWQGHGHVSSESTEALPNGLPANGILAISGRSEPAVIPVGTPGGMVLSPEELGSYMAMKERPDLFPEMQQAFPFDRFKLATQGTLDVRIQLNEQLVILQPLIDVTNRSQQELTFTQLPEDFRKAAEAMRDEMRKSLKDVTPDQIGSRQGPPPPY